MTRNLMRRFLRLLGSNERRGVAAAQASRRGGGEGIGRECEEEEGGDTEEERGAS